MERRRQLLGVKLSALVRDHTGSGDVGPLGEFGPGAALVHDGAAWVLVDDRPSSRLGAALAWALRAGAGELHVVADDGTGVLARRAAEFAFPVTVWHAEGRDLLRAVPGPFDDPRPIPAEHADFVDLIVAGGAEPIVEHGVLAGEVRGLEVCRVVDDPHTGTTRLEVGVGAHDREAFTMLHGDVPPAKALVKVVAAVRPHREPGAPPHPLGRLAGERALRFLLLERPDLVDARELVVADPPIPRTNVKDPAPCVAVGRDLAGGRVIVVCSVGVDLDVVATAADARLRHGPADRLLLAVPARDRVAIIEELAGQLRDPAEVVTVDR